MTNSDNEQVQTYQSVGGWLLLLCLALTIFSPLRSVYNLATAYNETLPFFDEYPGLKMLFYVDGLLSLILMILSVRAGIALWTIKPGAVKIAKNYLLIFLGYSLIAIFLPFLAGLPSVANEAMIPEVAKGAIQALIYFGVWYSYLNVSKRVKATYPEFFTKIESDYPISEENNSGGDEQKNIE